MNQIARNLTDSVDGLLTGKRYLIHDRDPLFTKEFLCTLKDAGVESVKLPPRSPNLNAHAERFVRSIKESCLERLILFARRILQHHEYPPVRACQYRHLVRRFRASFGTTNVGPRNIQLGLRVQF